MMVFGLTGPSGAGKTTALTALRRLGFDVVDCDALYHELLRRDETLRQALRDTFGAETFLPDGRLDRKWLAARVFSDAGELKKLNNIVYPAMNAAVEQKIRACKGRGIAIDAINLIESGMGDLCEVTVALTADPAVRAKRIIARDALTEEQAWQRIRAQKPDKFYRKNCTFVLENRAGSEAEFQKLIQEFFEDLIFDLEG